MGDERVGEGLTREGGVGGEGSEGLPCLVSVVGDEGAAEGSLESVLTIYG